MENTSDERKIIEAEIEKTEKDIRKAVEDYNEVSRQNSDHLNTYNAIPPDPSGAYKEMAKIQVDTMLDNNKALTALRNTIKALQSRLDTLKQSKENKLNKIVFREDLEEVDKLQKEAEELRQRKSELSIKYAKPKTQDTPAMFDWLTDDKQEVYCNSILWNGYITNETNSSGSSFIRHGNQNNNIKVCNLLSLAGPNSTTTIYGN